MFSNLPIEIINNILSFEGTLRYRNGKWMNPLNLPKKIKEKILNCIKRKYNSIDKDHKIVCWSVEIHTYKRLSLFIRKDSFLSNLDYIGLDNYVGDYRIINYKKSICHSGEMTFTTMLIDDITTFNVIW